MHHLQPLSTDPGERIVDVMADMVVACANCHAMIHRIRERTLTVEELQKLIADNRAVEFNSKSSGAN